MEARYGPVMKPCSMWGTIANPFPVSIPVLTRDLGNSPHGASESQSWRCDPIGPVRQATTKQWSKERGQVHFEGCRDPPPASGTRGRAASTVKNCSPMEKHRCVAAQGCAPRRKSLRAPNIQFIANLLIDGGPRRSWELHTDGASLASSRRTFH